MEAGNNVSMDIVNGKIVLTIDPTINLGLSKSGKNYLVASTNGFKTLSNGFQLGLNIIRK